MSQPAFTVLDLEAIRSAIAKGERSVQFADRIVVYRSIEELLAAEARIAQSLAETTNGSRNRTFKGYATKGF